jgi:hypothetical protein
MNRSKLWQIDSAYRAPRVQTHILQPQKKKAPAKTQEPAVVRVDIAHVFSGLFGLSVLFFSLFLYIDSINDVYSHEDALYAQFPTLCSSSSWITITEEKDAGNLENWQGYIYSDGEKIYSRSDNSIFSKPQNLSLTYFEGKKIEIVAERRGPELLRPIRLRCVHSGSEEYINKTQMEIIDHVRYNFDGILPQGTDAVVDEIGFSGNDIVYVHFVDRSGDHVYGLKIIYLPVGFAHEIFVKYDMKEGELLSEGRVVYSREMDVSMWYEFDRIKQKWVRVW